MKTKTFRFLQFVGGIFGIIIILGSTFLCQTSAARNNESMEKQNHELILSSRNLLVQSVGKLAPEQRPIVNILANKELNPNLSTKSENILVWTVVALTTLRYLIAITLLLLVWRLGSWVSLQFRTFFDKELSGRTRWREMEIIERLVPHLEDKDKSLCILEFVKNAKRDVHKKPDEKKEHSQVI